MQIFDGEIKKDEGGRLTCIALPFNAKEVFCAPAGTIFVAGTINGAAYRSRLLARGGGSYCLVVGKALQKTVGFCGSPLAAHVTMAHEAETPPQLFGGDSAALASGMDVLTAIKTRRSIRHFTGEPIGPDALHTILAAGMCAPTAKNKRPCHFILLQNRRLLVELAQENPNAAMLEQAACGIVVCGDQAREGTKEFLHQGCAAATQNILLCAHGLGLGGVWCGVVAGSSWQKLLVQRLELPIKLLPVAVVALGHPSEAGAPRECWQPEKLHCEKW